MANEQKNQSETSKPALSKQQIKVFQAWFNSEYGSRVPRISLNDAKSIMIEKGLTGPVILTEDARPQKILFRSRIREAEIYTLPPNFPES